MLVESTAYKQDTGDTIYPASGPQGGNPTCCLSDGIDDDVTGVSKLELRVLRVVLVSVVVAIRLLARNDGPSCAFIAQARSKVTVSY